MATTNTEYDDLSLAELHDKAKENGLTGTSHMKKDELIEALSSGKSSKNDSASASSDDRKRDDKGHFEKSDAKASSTKSAEKSEDEADGQYGDLTLAELHDKAKEAGLSSTSHMKKEELIEALTSGEKSSNAKSGADDSKTTKSHASSQDNADRPRDDKGHFEKTGGDKNADQKETAKR